MKKCPMCGSAAIDNAAICFECLYSFDRMSCAAMIIPVPGDASQAVCGGARDATSTCRGASSADLSLPEAYDVAVDDPDSGYSTYSLGPGTLHVGRLPDNDIVFSDRMVSRRHLRLFVEQEQVWAEVLGARNPPRINGEPFWGRVRVTSEDVIHVRQATLRLVNRDVDGTIS